MWNTCIAQEHQKTKPIMYMYQIVFDGMFARRVIKIGFKMSYRTIQGIVKGFLAISGRIIQSN